jgi:hypothetical protein
VFGSSAISASIAQCAFWVLVVVGWSRRELGPRSLTAFLLLWLGGVVGLRYVPSGALFITSFTALLDIVLVLAVFKGDIRLT